MTDGDDNITATNPHKFFEVWIKEIEMMGIDVNIEKSKTMIIDKKTEVRTTNKIFCTSKEIKEVVMYEYL